MSEWQRRFETLGKYKQVLSRQQSIYATLEAASAPALAADVDSLQRDLNWADELNSRLERQRGTLEAEQLDSDFRAMEQKRSQLLDVYTRAFNTPQERPALEALLAHLQRMLENRMAAQQLGSAAAAAQAAQLRSEIEKLRRR